MEKYFFTYVLCHLIFTYTRIAVNANQSQARYNKVYHTKHPA